MIEARQSYWEEVLYNQHCDVLIVGAGLTGLSTALFSKRKNPNARVVVLERGVFPIGASTRNAGFACIGTVGEHLADLELDSETKLKERIKSRFEGLQLLTSTLGEQEIDYDPCGGWEIFTDQQVFEEVAIQVDRFNNWMSELIGEEEVYSIGKFEGYPAIFNRVEGALHPGKMIQKLIALNIAAGVEIRWQTEVKHLDFDNGIVTGSHTEQWNAENVVLATNAFTNRLSNKETIKPGRGLVFVTSPIKDIKWKSTFHYDKGYVYFRNLGADRLLIGGGRNVDYDKETTNEFGINESIKNFLIGFVNDVIKLPKGWKIEREWSGIMGFTESKSPSLEKIGAKTWQVAGLSGMGVALGMALGKKAAEQLRINN
ncbi:MAG: FAD-binding oxidoreductase [Balneolaceae bacterium]|nr:FAD-binding oxidoreductase [Balneolaceae bacterium]